MTIVYSIVFLLYGMVFGSFFNVVGLRVPAKESIIRPPSHCTSCNRQLTMGDLIPVLSYVFLRGQCRSCGAKVSPIYPEMELLTGLLFMYSYYYFGFSAELIVALLFMSMLVIITVSDMAYMVIPDKILALFLPLLIMARLVSPLTPWWSSIVGALVGFSLLYLVAIVSRGGMGGGDIKLFFVLGIVLGWQNVLLTLMLASMIGLVVGIIVLKILGKSRKTPIPFGPSIALAAMISYFYGERIISWYMTLF